MNPPSGSTILRTCLRTASYGAIGAQIAIPQFLYNLGVSKPGGNITAFVEPLSQFCPGNVQHAGALWYLIIGDIFILIFQINHHVELHHADANVSFVSLEQLLGFVGSVERFAVRVIARAGVITSYDEMRAAVVLADQRMPDSLARSSHAHGQREERELYGSGRKFRE